MYDVQSDWKFISIGKNSIYLGIYYVSEAILHQDIFITNDLWWKWRPSLSLFKVYAYVYFNMW